mmetsp:Transcript_39270/g.76678  ORF Transcript_39270/g.76678 Transcript_39270/m.76678 type:complete len:352 (-) Transcript_39270:1192-2247(-)
MRRRLPASRDEFSSGALLLLSTVLVLLTAPSAPPFARAAGMAAAPTLNEVGTKKAISLEPHPDPNDEDHDGMVYVGRIRKHRVVRRPGAVGAGADDNGEGAEGDDDDVYQEEAEVADGKAEISGGTEAEEKFVYHRMGHDEDNGTCVVVAWRLRVMCCGVADRLLCRRALRVRHIVRRRPPHGGDRGPLPRPRRPRYRARPSRPRAPPPRPLRLAGRAGGPGRAPEGGGARSGRGGRPGAPRRAQGGEPAAHGPRQDGGGAARGAARDGAGGREAAAVRVVRETSAGRGRRAAPEGDRAALLYRRGARLEQGLREVRPGHVLRDGGGEVRLEFRVVQLSTGAPRAAGPGGG